jgi:hypothetical protein
LEQVRLPNTLVPAGSHVICGRCTLPVGSFIDAACRIQAVTRCGCDRLPLFAEEPLPEQQPITTWERRQVACSAHMLCKICAAAWVPFQGRYSPYLCRSCERGTRQLNGLLGRCVVSIGAHSLNNLTKAVSGPVAPEVREAAAVLVGAALRPYAVDHIVEHAQLARFNRRADTIHMSLEVDRNLAGIRGRHGFQNVRVQEGEDMPLLRYLLAAPAVSEGSDQALLRYAQVAATVDGASHSHDA